jgi:hypothetical protein
MASSIETSVGILVCTAPTCVISWMPAMDCVGRQGAAASECPTKSSTANVDRSTGCQPHSGVVQHTSLELAGFKGFATEAKQIHLLVPRGAKVTPFPGVVIHESRRLGEERWTHDRGLTRTEDPRSVIDAAAWQPWPRFACLMVAAAVQQRMCTPAELDHALSYVGRVRHKAYLRIALADIAGGALPKPTCQNLSTKYGAEILTSRLRESGARESAFRGWSRGRSGRASSRRYARWGHAV